MLADDNIERWKRWRIGSALEELGDQSVAVRLLELLEQEAELDPLVRGCIVSALAKLKATFAVPHLIYLLRADTDCGLQEKIADVLVQAIAKTADDTKTVQIFLEMMPAKPKSEEEKHLAQVIYAALYAVSHRAGVRVRRDGHIESLIAASLASRGTT